MIIIKLKNILIKKIENHRENRIFYLRVVIHFIKYFLSSRYRNKYCLLDIDSEFFYKYKKLSKYLSIPLLIIARYFEKRRIFISVNNNNNSSVGHVYPEIDQLKRMQLLDNTYSNSHILFTSTKKEILIDTKDIFKSKDFTILIGGIKHLILTLVAIKNPSISIDASLGQENYIFGIKKHPPRISFQDKSMQRARLLSNSAKFYPNKHMLGHYHDKKNQLIKDLNITKNYIVLQMKNTPTNATFKPTDPNIYVDSIKYFQNKGYDIVFAGRETYPKVFIEYGVINYSTSGHASPMNDYLLVGNSSFVICSASGFCNIAETMDKPLLVVNSFHGIQQFGRRTILLPTLLARDEELFNARIQHMYLCKFGQSFGRPWFKDPKNLYLYHMATSREVLEAAKELEGMASDDIPPYTSLQKKIRENDGCPLLLDGLSRISDYYLSKYGYFFDK